MIMLYAAYAALSASVVHPRLFELFLQAPQVRSNACALFTCVLRVCVSRQLCVSKHEVAAVH